MWRKELLQFRCLQECLDTVYAVDSPGGGNNFCYFLFCKKDYSTVYCKNPA